MEDFTDVVLDTIKGVRDQLLVRIEGLEKQAPSTITIVGPPGEKGESIVGPKGEPGENGKDVDPAIVQSLTAEIASLKEEIVALRNALATQMTSYAADVETLKIDMRALVMAEAMKAVAALPVPKDGMNGRDGRDGQDAISLTVEDVAPLVRSEIETRVKAMPVPKDGVGLAGALIDRDGQLVLTLSDGTTKSLGCVVGAVNPQDVVRAVNEQLATWPRPENGRDGRDGSLEGLRAVYDGERTVTLCFKNGDPIDGGVIKFVGLAIYRGVFVDGRTYEPGDLATWGGHMWMAKETTTLKPDDTGLAAKAWVLCVRRGKDGKPGPKGDKGEPGVRGEKGDRGPDRW